MGGARKGKPFIFWFLPLPLHASRLQFSAIASDFVGWVRPDLGATAAAAPPWSSAGALAPWKKEARREQKPWNLKTFLEADSRRSKERGIFFL